MYRVAIVEDSPDDARHLNSLLARYGEKTKTQFHIQVFERPLGFLTQCREGFDLVVMDIEQPELDGMETARRLRECDPAVTLIFVTNMAQYALNGYEVGALDFVLKPVGYAPFAMKLRKAIRNIDKLRDADILLFPATGFVRMPVSRIFYVEVQKHYLTYHTDEGDYVVRESMKAAEEALSQYHFLRCNNCYLVNLRQVTAVDGNVVRVGGVPLQISRPRRAEFLKGLTDYLGGSVR